MAWEDEGEGVSGEVTARAVLPDLTTKHTKNTKAREARINPVTPAFEVRLRA